MSHRLLLIFALSLPTLCCAIGRQVVGDDVATQVQQRLSVPVKLLTPPPPVENNMAVMAALAALEPTTPGGKLPQYQLGHLNRSIPEEADFSDPRLRLLLALPQAPVLVEATIFINGKPYLMPREDRVQDLVKYVADPEQYHKDRVTLADQTKDLVNLLKDSILKAVSETAAEAEESPTGDNTGTKSDGEKIGGTPSGDVNSEAPDDAAAGDEETENETEEAADKIEDIPAVAEYSAPSSIYNHIQRYMAATEERPTATELRWLLTDWVDGPVVLLLNDNFQRFRADQTPVFTVLDRDRDQSISAKELELAVTSFQECDLDRDDVVLYSELAEVARDPRVPARHAGHGKLIFSIPTEATADSTYERLADRYRLPEDETALLPRFDTNQNRRLDKAEIEDLMRREADLRITINFNTKKPNEARFEVTHIAAEFADQTRQPVLNPGSVTVLVGGTRIDFSAVQNADSDQISVGAVDDGYPMLPVLDPNDDGRFTIRELRSLNQKLMTFDANGDGILTRDEAQSTLRVCFGLGPLVHSELAGIRSMSPALTSPAAPGPDWFVRMDRNKDNDLTRKEFVGSDEQFANLDADSDDLISGEEAERFRQK